MKKFLKIKFLGYCIAGTAIFAGIYFFVAGGSYLRERRDVSFGVTFSTVMARQLGLDEKKTFDAIVDDLGAKKVRIPVYWQDVEPGEGKFDFGAYDYFIKKAEEKNVALVLVIGRKLPRWPECHVPAWAQFERRDLDATSEDYMEAVVERYKNSSAVSVWQIENEHFHVFGAQCAEGKLSAELVDREIALVRSRDSRPIMLTDAGKAGAWFTSLSRAEVLGVTMYYQVWNPARGIVWSTFGPGLYVLKRAVLQPFFPGKKIIVSELQAEPYGPTLLPEYDLSTQKKLMNAERFNETIRRARKAGFDENYLWGAEWWFWLKEKKGDSSLWEEAKKIFHE